MTTDKEHLQWMLNRLVEVYGENRNVDYITRMQKIIDNTKTELNLHLVSFSLPTKGEIDKERSKLEDGFGRRNRSSYSEGLISGFDVCLSWLTKKTL